MIDMRSKDVADAASWNQIAKQSEHLICTTYDDNTQTWYELASP
jgi:hypothetical protein